MLYGDLSPSFRKSVARWIQHFSGGRDIESVEDKAHAGRPPISVTDRSGKRAEALRPNYNTQILSLGAWCKLLKCTCYCPGAACLVREVPGIVPPPVDNRTERMKGNKLQEFETNGPIKWFSDVVTGDEG